LADGTRTLGIWTGARWWSTKGEIHPVRWELEVREKKTKKLLKSLESEGEKLDPSRKAPKAISS
jgi:hypothetical protein